jgi:hypothetical protein
MADETILVMVLLSCWYPNVRYISANDVQRRVTILTPEYVFILDTAYFNRLHSWSRLNNFIAHDLERKKVMYMITTVLIKAM